MVGLWGSRLDRKGGAKKGKNIECEQKASGTERLQSVVVVAVISMLVVALLCFRLKSATRSLNTFQIWPFCLLILSKTTLSNVSFPLRYSSMILRKTGFRFRECLLGHVNIFLFVSSDYNLLLTFRWSPPWSEFPNFCLEQLNGDDEEWSGAWICIYRTRFTDRAALELNKQNGHER